MARRRGAVADALDRLGGQPVELCRQLGVGGGVDDRVQVPVGSERGGELLAPAGEEVHHASGNVRDAQHLGEVEAGEWVPFGQDRDVAAGQRGPELSDQPKQRRRVRRDDPDDAGRLVHQERQKRRRDGIDTPEDRVGPVGPARVVEQHVDGGNDLVAHPPARDSSASARYRIWPRL